MIARIWNGLVAANVADAYHRYLLQTGIPDYRRTPGNRGIHLLRRLERDVAHFQIITLWDDIESVRAFAGDDVARARYYPADDEFLLRKELYVEHYDVLDLGAGSERPLSLVRPDRGDGNAGSASEAGMSDGAGPATEAS